MGKVEGNRTNTNRKHYQYGLEIVRLVQCKSRKWAACIRFTAAILGKLDWKMMSTVVLYLSSGKF